MRWRPGGVSGDIEDRRGEGGAPRGGRGARLGLGGLLLLVLLSVIFKQDFVSLVTGDLPPQGLPAEDALSRPPADPRRDQAEQPLVEFVSFVLDDVQTTWADLLPRMGARYQNAKLVLFRDAVESACGYAQAASGPFYCPGDRKVYIDLGFYEELHREFGAPGDFAQAYVLAHEIGHHIQTVLGIEEKVRRAQRGDPSGANALSVRMELQADCLAGVWGHAASRRDILEPGDVDEGLRAAAAIGDDRIQRMAGRNVHPESFTHGSSEQRVQWFRRGLASGDPNACQTFSAGF